MQLVHRDGKTIGEIRVEGSTVVMKGYLEDEEATGLAFEGGWVPYWGGECGGLHRHVQSDFPRGKPESCRAFLCQSW